jgi:prevent-host-death family protein
MKQIGAFEAKTHLPKFLEEVSHGTILTITRRGEPIAMLVPYKESKAEIKSMIADLRKWRTGISWNKGMSTGKAKKLGRR